MITITVHLKDDAEKMFKELSHGGRAHSDIVKDALWLTYAVRQAIDNGGSFIIKGSNGKEREYMLRNPDEVK